MGYRNDKYLDISAIIGIMKYCYKLTGIPYSFTTPDGNVFIKNGADSICSNICKRNVNAPGICTENQCQYKKAIFRNDNYTIYKCVNGVTEVIIPMYVEKVHIANLIIGQAFLEEPDIDSFIGHVKGFEMKRDMCIETLEDVPVITRAELDFYANTAALFSNSIVNNFRFVCAEKIESEYDKGFDNLLYDSMDNTSLHDTSNKSENYSYFIEEIQKANDSLCQEEERFKKLLEVLPYAVCVRIGERIVYANDTAAKIFAIDSPEKMINMSINDLFMPHPCMEQEFAKKLKRISEHYNTPLEEEILINKADGRILDVETSTMNIKYDNEDATLVVFKDITYKKQLEEANKELNENLNYERMRIDFFSNISHEFRTPLNIIYNAAKMGDIVLGNNCLNFGREKLESYLNMIEQNCFRLMKLVNNILDINKFDYDNIQLNLGKFNIISVIENTVNLIADYAKNKNLNLLFDTDAEEVITMCDAEKIERVMFNLLSNAIKFTPSGGEISVMLSYNDGNVIISVKDTGKGIPNDKIDTIFEKFIQVDKSFTRDHEGSGLGLYIVRSIVEMHGGTIRVESILGEGSNFIVNLPVMQPKDVINNIQVFNPNSEMLNIEFSDIDREM